SVPWERSWAADGLEHAARRGVTRVEFQAPFEGSRCPRALTQLGIRARQREMRVGEAGVELHCLLERLDRRLKGSAAEMGDSQVGVSRGLPWVDGDGAAIRGPGAVQGDALLHER